METSIVGVKPVFVNPDKVEAYILGTLMYTPLFFVKNEKHIKFAVYSPGDTQPSMIIFRMLARYDDSPGLEKTIKICFQDEVSFLTESNRIDPNKRWQVNFDILIDRETYEYKAVLNKPKDLSCISECIQVFSDLSTREKSLLIAGDQHFVSDGDGWVLKMGSIRRPSVLPEYLSLQE